MTPETIIRRPIMLTEKANLLARRTRSSSRSRATRTRVQIRDAVQKLFNVTVTNVNTLAHARQRPPHGARLRQDAELEEGDRHPQGGRHDRILRRAKAEDRVMGIKSYKPTSARASLLLGLRFQGAVTKGVEPEKSLLEHQTSTGGRNAPRPHHQPLPRRRPQAALPHHRLASRQDRRAGHGRDDRVRPEPHGAHRAPALRGRREALHPRPRRPGRGRQDRLEPPRRHQARQLDAPPLTSRSARRSTTSR